MPNQRSCTIVVYTNIIWPGHTGFLVETTSTLVGFRVALPPFLNRTKPLSGPFIMGHFAAKGLSYCCLTATLKACSSEFRLHTSKFTFFCY